GCVPGRTVCAWHHGGPSSNRIALGWHLGVVFDHSYGSTRTAWSSCHTPKSPRAQRYAADVVLFRHAPGNLCPPRSSSVSLANGRNGETTCQCRVQSDDPTLEPPRPARLPHCPPRGTDQHELVSAVACLDNGIDF